MHSRILFLGIYSHAHSVGRRAPVVLRLVDFVEGIIDGTKKHLPYISIMRLCIDNITKRD